MTPEPDPYFTGCCVPESETLFHQRLGESGLCSWLRPFSSPIGKNVHIPKPPVSIQNSRTSPGPSKRTQLQPLSNVVMPRAHGLESWQPRRRAACGFRWRRLVAFFRSLLSGSGQLTGQVVEGLEVQLQWLRGIEIQLAVIEVGGPCSLAPRRPASFSIPHAWHANSYLRAPRHTQGIPRDPRLHILNPADPESPIPRIEEYTLTLI